MAKGKKRVRSKKSASSARPRSYSELYKEQANATVVPTPAPKAPASAKSKVAPAATLRGSDTVAWEQEYQTVFKDLRHLLVVSASLFALMVILGFLL
jgi:hypothetical protein